MYMCCLYDVLLHSVSSLHYTYLTCEQALRVTRAGGWVRASLHDFEFKMAPLWACCQKSINQHSPDCKHWQHVLCRYLVYHGWGRNSGTKICKGKKPSAESRNNYFRCCKTPLRILYGSTWSSFSTEILFRQSGKKGKKTRIIIKRSPFPKDSANHAQLN